MTQAAMAEQLHVSRKTISSWETGRTYPDVTMLVKISDAYQVSLDNLLKEDLGLLTHFQQQDQASSRRQRWGRWSLAVNVGAVLLYYFLAFLRVNVDWLGSLLLLNLIVLWQSGRQYAEWSPKGWWMVAIIGAVILVNVAFVLLQPALKQRQIHASHRMCGNLRAQALMRRIALGYQQQPGSVLVDAVQYARTQFPSYARKPVQFA